MQLVAEGEAAALVGQCRSAHPDRPGSLRPISLARPARRAGHDRGVDQRALPDQKASLSIVELALPVRRTSPRSAPILRQTLPEPPVSCCGSRRSRLSSDSPAKRWRLVGQTGRPPWRGPESPYPALQQQDPEHTSGLGNDELTLRRHRDHSPTTRSICRPSPTRLLILVQHTLALSRFTTSTTSHPSSPKLTDHRR